MARDENEDQTGALIALNEAVRLAPYYAQPRWQRGNLLLRMGRYDDAFVDLRSAARSNPSLLPNLLDLSWGLSKGDVSITEQLADISSPQMRKDFALFLAAQGKAAATLGQLKLAGPIEPEIKERVVARLLGQGAYPEALEVWGAGTNIAPEAVYDGGFEVALRLDETQFGWRVQSKQPGVEVSLETAEVRSGEKSLHIELTGDSNFGIPIVSQLIVVKPNTTYEVSFAARTRDVVTAARPLMTVDDASARTRLGESPSLPAGSSDWQLINFSFTTGANTQAVMLSLQKERCATGRCPAFGSIWLDEISISRK
jgi:tetratricopeptide (TPR) repeat protein